MARKKTPKKKVEVVFDTEKRKEFLTGFRKRKNERRTRAKAELTKNLKDERIRIRQEVKEGFKHLKKSYEPLKELTEADKAGEEKQETYEDDEVQVKIVELSTNDLAAHGNMIGANTGEESEEEEKQSESEVEDTSRPDRIPGMDYDPSARKRKAAPAAVEPKAKKPAHSDDPDIRSKKDLDKLMKTKTLKKMHKSKVFKQKERLDKQVNLKKAKRNHNNTIKSVPKHQRKKLKYGAGQPTVYSKGRKLNKKEIRRQRGD
ncbi:nucleolar protein 12 [Drosophila pseudoobscura]|uniref:Nucleolar protein 12 n=1 Tax=Drosophila pseudoobscura pseudoobscura TaxID=46245 RepID=Q2LZB2_DROPS|nr:nucleolar protein 12 [Drosophila pseudoobscura]